MKKPDFPELARKNIRTLKPYQAKDVRCSVKLDANESPYTFVPANGVIERIASETLNRYPDPEAKRLKRAIARKIGIDTDAILLGNGSDELIYYLVITFGGPVLYPVPTFSMYGIIAQALGERHIGVPLDRDYDLNIDKMAASIKKYRPKLIFLSSPNNPTGNCFSADRILKIVDMAKGIVVLDEAYQPFSSRKGFLPMVKDYDQLVILRTLSKIGLASLRVGYLVADRALIREVDKVRLPFNLNALSQAVAAAALRGSLLSGPVKAIISERERLYEALSNIPGARPYPS
ncbi:MAG TPA: aminotransferase class I/II-fold pyridoxal phosphate-dependent enzyme, partial [Dissulfurispiraceae bacterium]|nr:aminotransferase class I/II-fold pyridoxal phosphate-dependent enzyme [Dissulfurispiraceae bacterium]